MIKAKSFISKLFTPYTLFRHFSIIVGLVALFFLSQYNFLLFHCIIEGFSIAIAFSIFLFAWNTRRMLNDNFLVLVGIAFLFVGILDFFHTLAYRGMNIFDISDGNVATQLWIGTRYIQSLSILATAFLINRKVRPALAFFTYTAVTVIFLLSVFQWQVFPVCYIEGSGLTPFKIVSEYCISFVVLVSMLVIWKKREKFEFRIAVLILASLGLMIFSEMAFTLYRDVYGILNVIGHILKLISFYLLYVAIVESGLKNPLSVLFRELKKGNESLQEQIRLRQDSEAQYRASLDNSPISIHVYSKKRELVFVNKTDLARNGYASLEEFKSIPVEKKLTPDSVPMAAQWKQDSASGKPLPDSFFIDTITKSGEIRNLRALRSEIFWNGEIHDQIIYQDITEQKQAEEREKRLQDEVMTTNRLAAVGRMASGIAHEINNPLTWVIGYSELLLDRDLPEDVHNDIHAVYEGSMRMASIIQRMLAFARRNEPEYAVVQMNTLVEETLKLRSHDMKVNNIDVTLNCTPDLPEIFVDGSQIQQVFLNIILNAEIEMKKAHNGGHLTITTESMAGGLRVTFTDDGPGIPEDDMERLFEPFFTTREVGEGTGLGLSVSYGIVARHGGRIYARSTPGQGASFIVELPFRETSAEPPAENDNRPQVPAGTRILVVDDESLIRNYLSDVLKLEQCVVTTAESGMKALELIHRQKFDVVMLDVKMPGMTGIELYEKLKEEADDMAGRVIFVTGDLMSSETMSFVVNSTIPFVAKPFDAEQIIKTIHRVVSR